jgi:hypothetical protein
MSKTNPKKKTSFSISADVDALLSKLAEKNSRSKASMLEVLVKEAAAASHSQPRRGHLTRPAPVPESPARASWRGFFGPFRPGRPARTFGPWPSSPAMN